MTGIIAGAGLARTRGPLNPATLGLRSLGAVSRILAGLSFWVGTLGLLVISEAISKAMNRTTMCPPVQATVLSKHSLALERDRFLF